MIGKKRRTSVLIGVFLTVILLLAQNAAATLHEFDVGDMETVASDGDPTADADADLDAVKGIRSGDDVRIWVNWSARDDSTYGDISWHDFYLNVTSDPGPNPKTDHKHVNLNYGESASGVLNVTYYNVQIDTTYYVEIACRVRDLESNKVDYDGDDCTVDVYL